MNNRIVSLISILLLVVFVGAMLAGCGSNSAATAASSAGASGGASDGNTLMQARCTVCHSASRITSSHKTAAQWKQTVDRMINNGAQLNAQEEQVLIDYLALNYK